MQVVARRDVGAAQVSAVVGDLAQLPVDAVVNAANTHLQHGGGVAGALSRAAGPGLQEESNAWVAEHGPLAVGTAAVTTGGDLPCRWVVHVAGPVHGRGEPDDETHLRAATRAALLAADEAGARTVALPAISAGIYGYPPAEATAIISDEVLAVLATTELETVLLVGLDTAMADLFAAGLDDA